MQGKSFRHAKNVNVKIANKIIKTETSVKLFGITIDNSLNFNSHKVISTIKRHLLD